MNVIFAYLGYALLTYSLMCYTVVPILFIVLLVEEYRLVGQWKIDSEFCWGIVFSPFVGLFLIICLLARWGWIKGGFL